MLGRQLVGVFFLRNLKFSRMVIYRLKKTEATSTMENCIVTQSKLLLGFPIRSISCRVSFVLRCFYKGTLVVCAVARTVSRFVQRSFDLHGSFGFIQISPSTPSTRSKIQKKIILVSQTLPLKFISAPRKAKHFIGQLWQLMTASNVGARIQVWQANASGWFSKSRGLSASVSFLSSPPPPRSFTCATFLAVFD